MFIEILLRTGFSRSDELRQPPERKTRIIAYALHQVLPLAGPQTQGKAQNAKQAALSRDVRYQLQNPGVRRGSQNIMTDQEEHRSRTHWPQQAFAHVLP